MNFDDEVLIEINKNADLLSYAEQVLELKQQGDNYFAHCPLHIDNTASLCFSPKTNSCHCFSCGKSGGMIGYLINFEKLSFEEAVKKAASLANIDMSKMCQSETIILLRKWQRFFQQKEKQQIVHEVLPETAITKFAKEQITEWLDEGISQEMIDLFGIRVDTISNRIVYPVYDMNKKLINIKGRTRYKNYKNLKLPKYINYYSVGVMDYFQSLELTLPYIKEKNEIIIFESIKSVMKAYSWGYKNCVSAEKHTLTPEQINLLIKLRVNVVFAYDTDVDYYKGEIKQNIDRLRKITNVFIIEDYDNLLGGIETKNAPVDCGYDIWEELYLNKKKVV